MTLERLNELTQVWVEGEYHRAVHAEIATSPLERYRDAPLVGRDCPSSERLRQAFTRTVSRLQRRSDTIVSRDGRRLEIPGRYRPLERPRLRYARWDLSRVELLDPHTREPLCRLFPLDKAANAEGRRRRLDPPDPPPSQGTLQEALRPAWSSWMPMGTLYYRGHRGMAAEIFQFDATGLVTRSLATYALA